MFKSRSGRLASAAVLLAVVAALVILLNGLWGKSKGQPASSSTSVSITFACRDYQRDWYQELADEFHKRHPSSAVEIISADEILDQTVSGGIGSVSSDDIYKVARAADTFSASSLSLGASPQDIALDLSELAAHDGGFDPDDFYPAPLSLFQSGDKLWGLPVEVNSFFVFYRPELFDHAGVSYPQIGWTWEDLMEKARQLTVRQDGAVKQYGFVDPWARYTLSALAHQKAGPLIKTDRGFPEARLDGPDVSAAVRWYADLALTQEVMLDPTTVDQAALQVIAHEKLLPMWVGLSSEWDNFTDKIGVVPLPEAGGGAMPISAMGYLVSAGTAHPEEAWQWVSFLSQQLPYRYANGVPARKSVIARAHYWNKMSQETAAAFQYCLEHAILYPGTIRWELGHAFEVALQGGSVQDALFEGQARANQELADAATAAQRPPATVAVATPVLTPTPGGTTVRFYVVQALGTDWALYRALADRFHQKHPDISIEVESGPQLPLTGSLISADCFIDNAARVQFEAAGGILDLTPLLAEDKTFNRALFYSSFLHQVERDGTLWGLPLEASARLLYYNRALFDRAGLSYPTSEWTPLHLIDQAAAFTDDSLTEPIYGFSLRDGAYINAEDYVVWLGGQLFDADRQPTFDDPSVIKATAAFAELIRSSPPAAQARNGNRWSAYSVTAGTHPALASSGQVAMWVDQYDAHLGAQPLDFDAGVAPLPVGAAPIGYSAVRALFIGAETDVPDACWSWITFLSAQPEAVQWLPVRRDIAAGNEWRERVGQETSEAWSSILSRDALQPSPGYNSAEYNALYWFDEALADVLGGESPAAALTGAQAKASAFVDCMRDRGNAQEAWSACVKQADPEVHLE